MLTVKIVDAKDKVHYANVQHFQSIDEYVNENLPHFVFPLKTKKEMTHQCFFDCQFLRFKPNTSIFISSSFGKLKYMSLMGLLKQHTSYSKAEKDAFVSDVLQSKKKHLRSSDGAFVLIFNPLAKE